jgi:hypothetical protein
MAIVSMYVRIMHIYNIYVYINASALRATPLREADEHGDESYHNEDAKYVLQVYMYICINIAHMMRKPSNTIRYIVTK